MILQFILSVVSMKVVIDLPTTTQFQFQAGALAVASSHPVMNKGCPKEASGLLENGRISEEEEEGKKGDGRQPVRSSSKQTNICSELYRVSQHFPILLQTLQVTITRLASKGGRRIARKWQKQRGRRRREARRRRTPNRGRRRPRDLLFESSASAKSRGRILCLLCSS